MINHNLVFLLKLKNIMPSVIKDGAVYDLQLDIQSQIKETFKKELQTRLKKAEDSLEQQTQILHRFEKEAELKIEQGIRLKEIYYKVKEDYQELQGQLQRVTSNFQDTKNQLDETTKTKNLLKQELNNLKSVNQQASRQNHRLNSSLILASQQTQQLRIEREDLNRERERSIMIEEQMRVALNQVYLVSKFDGDILEDKLQYKQYIKEAVEKYTGKKIYTTKKIYQSEKDLSFSFHKYADQVPDIVVLVKTKAGFYLAGYSESPISNKTPASKGGLIMALNNKKTFPVIPGKKSVTYDSFFLIIGNSEIRLKNQQWKVFSNFGIANSFFNCMGCGVNDLLGEGTTAREVQIVNFEIHRVIYR